MNQPQPSSYPLTQSQELLWTSQKLLPDVPINNVPYAFWISGNIDTTLFQKSFQKLVDLADVLRLVFEDVDGSPYQHALPEWNYALEIHNFETSSDTEIKTWLKQRAQKKFDFSKPLFDSALIRVNDKKSIWFLNLHHLVTDATTSVILFETMSAIYDSLQDGSPDTLPIVPSYIDYVGFENSKQQEQVIKDLKSYWKEKANFVADGKGLFGKRNKSSITETERVSLVLKKEITDRIAIALENPIMRSWTKELAILNFFTTILAAYLFRLSGQKKLAIGIPLHNRTSRSFRDTAGLLMEIFPLLVEVDEEDTFKTLFNRVKLATANLLKQSDFGVTSADANRKVNVIFNYITTKFPDFSDFPSKAEWVHPGHCDPSHHMRCHLYDMNGTGELELTFDLNKGIVDEESMPNVNKQFLNLVESFLEEIETPICSPALLSKKEAGIYLKDLEAIQANDEHGSTIELFEKIVDAQPKNIALVNGNQTYPFKTLDEKANQLALYLIKKGIGPEKRVAIHLFRSPEYIVSILAVLKTGATFIPIPSNQTEARIKFILKDSDCALVLTEQKLRKNLGDNTLPLIDLNVADAEIQAESKSSPSIQHRGGIAYILYTSGSTGNPKGVAISNKALYNYLVWAGKHYGISEESIFPLFTSIGFDLTITSTFLPLLNGGQLVIYKEAEIGPDVALFQVLGANIVNTVKLTPSHLSFLKDRDMSNSLIKTLIVGGEDFKAELARSVTKSFGQVDIYNEYGPTEATVGCVVAKYDPDTHTDTSVPIGSSIKNMAALVLDSHLNLVPKGVIGELYLAGNGLAEGYLNLEELTEQKFLTNPFDKKTKLYRTGDLARYNDHWELEYLGRVDEQIKLRGFRIELPDIEANLASHPFVENTAVILVEGEERVAEEDVVNCTECGLPSNYPTADFDANGVCHLCNSFKKYKHKVDHYFKTEDDLKRLLTSIKGKNPEYDCLSLLSGGKDSTYILAQLVNMGMRVLAFTLDNGYISDQAKANIQNVVEKLGVDHIYGSTQHMNKIFVDSLERHKNVCDGCFKTIYTLSTQVALEKRIPFIVTGLSRGQFFETRLTEELFWNTDFEAKQIDDTILEARKLYHKEDDAIRKLLDVSAFDDESTFDKVQFIDFYRYSDVSLEEMIRFLEEKIDWKRPTDTGRSTNCLINQVGIYVHKKQKGYSNYSFPYSWDVRLGHKTRQETLDEINEYIHEDEVLRIMDEIGYVEPMESDMDMQRLVGYYSGPAKISSNELKSHLKKELPDYMVPSHFKYVDEFPLTVNGKIDKTSLKNLSLAQLDMDSAFVAPSGEIEEALAKIWKEVLKLKQVGAEDDFISLGGHSLAAIRVSARVKEEFHLDVPLNKIFEFQTISSYASYVEETIKALLEES